MEDQTDTHGSFRKLWRWLKMPPQVYVFYLTLLILVWLVSFYAGTLNPRRTITPMPPPVSAPQR